MGNKISLSLIALIMGLFLTLPALAHTPMLYVEDNMDGTIYLEGGFSDGSSASGVKIYLLEEQKFSGDTAVRDQYLEKIFTGKSGEKLDYLKALTGKKEAELKNFKFSALKAEFYEGKLIIYQTVLDEYSECQLQKPEGAYLVVFDAGPGHKVVKQGPVLKSEEK